MKSQGAYAAAVTIGSRQFGQDRYEDAVDLLMRGASVNAVWVGDLMTQFEFFRVQAHAIDAEFARLPWWMSDEDKATWRTLAKDQYRRSVQKLYTTFMDEWEERAGRPPCIFEHARNTTIPLASIVLLFPEECPALSELPAAREPVMRAMFELLADLAKIYRGPGSGSSLAGLTPPPSKRTLQ